MAVTALHYIDFGFNPVPISFNVICVHTSGGIFEVQGVINYVVSGHCWQGGDCVVCCPLVTPYLCSWFSVLLDNGKE